MTPATNPPRTRRRRAMAVLFGLAVALLLVEGFARWSFAHPSPPAPEQRVAPPGMYVTADGPGFRFAPDVDLQGLQFRTNSQGLRDRERALRPAPAGVRRVVVLGDSFAAGWGVGDEGHFAALLQDALPAASSTPVEVWNLGVTHYGPEQSLELLVDLAARLEPDVVVFAFFAGNDVWEVVGGPGFSTIVDRDMVPVGWAPRARSRLNGRRASLNRIPGAPYLPLDAAAQRYSYAYRHVMTALAPDERRRWPFGLGEIDYETYGGIPWMEVEPTPEPVEKAWEMVSVVLGELRRHTAELGAELLVVSVPTRLAVDPESRARAEAMWARRGGADGTLVPGRSEERFAEIAAERKVEIIPLLPALREATDAGEAMHFRWDSHWTAGAHRTAAEVLGGHLADDVDGERLRTRLRELVPPGSYPTDTPPGAGPRRGSDRPR